jgi:hypothetical protein
MESRPVPPRPAGLGERRSDDRREVEAELAISVPAAELRGRAENLSQAGVFFFSGQSLRVRVEIETADGREIRAGRLVRVERMSRDSTGFAVEFDPQS